MPDFLDLLKQRGLGEPLPHPDCGGPAAQDVRPAGSARTWDFAFATGIECSNPSVAPPSGGGRLRRDLLEAAQNKSRGVPEKAGPTRGAATLPWRGERGIAVRRRSAGRSCWPAQWTGIACIAFVGRLPAPR